MNAAPARLWDFAPVQAAKKLWERNDLALFNAQREAENFDPHWPSLLHGMLYSDPNGEITIGNNPRSRLIQADYGKSLPFGRYRYGPRNIASYSVVNPEKHRFWSTRMAPYLIADLSPDRIGSFSSIVATATTRRTSHGYNEEAAAQTKQQLLKEFAAGENEWGVIDDLLRLTNELAAQLQIGCRKGSVDTCDLVSDFLIRPCVASEGAIAYMRGIGACNIPAPVTPRKKVNWQKNEPALRELWNDYLASGMNKKPLIKKWDISRQGLDRPLELGAEKFGYRPKIDADTWDETPGKRIVKGTRY